MAKINYNVLGIIFEAKNQLLLRECYKLSANWHSYNVTQIYSGSYLSSR